MIRLEDCDLLQLRSVDDEAAFFAQMGRFFASPNVRRECGGYPINDGPRYRWFVLRQRVTTRVLGFISLEQQTDLIRLRDGYLRPEARGAGLFRALLAEVLAFIDTQGLASVARLPAASAGVLLRRGFQVRSTRGSWVTLEKAVCRMPQA